MTPPRPPRLAQALLLRFVDDNEPLVGDLLEEFAARRSRLWFWRQVILAVLLAARRERHEVRPLKLVDGRPSFDSIPEGASVVGGRRRVNMTASPVPAVGGLGLVALATLMTLAAPQFWWVALVVTLAGAILGTTMVLVRRREIRR